MTSIAVKNPALPVCGARPTMFPISDALRCGKYINSAIYVSSFGKTRVPLIKNATRRLSEAGIKILGTVVNMSKFGGLSYSYYGYYKYKYNYNYAYAPDEGGFKGETKSQRREKTIKKRIGLTRFLQGSGRSRDIVSTADLVWMETGSYN